VFCFEVQPSLTPRPAVRLDRRDDVLWTRMRLGTARLAQWRNRVLGESDPRCPDCHREPETLRHLLLECPVWAQAREKLWTDAGLGASARQTLSQLLAWDIKSATLLSIRIGAIRHFLAETRRREFLIMVA